MAIKNGDKKSAIKTGDKKSAIKTGDKIGKTIKNIEKIREYLVKHGDVKAKDISEYIGLGPSRTRELLALMDDVETIGTNKTRLYRLK